jgi:outer membrane receptor protein involved in Fe transport
LPGYGLANARAGVKFRESWSATLFVNNLTNKRARLESMFFHGK